jgi:hypothetical protein
MTSALIPIRKAAEPGATVLSQVLPKIRSIQFALAT